MTPPPYCFHPHPSSLDIPPPHHPLLLSPLPHPSLLVIRPHTPIRSAAGHLLYPLIAPLGLQQGYQLVSSAMCMKTRPQKTCTAGISFHYCYAVVVGSPIFATEFWYFPDLRQTVFQLLSVLCNLVKKRTTIRTHSVQRPVAKSTVATHAR